MERNGKQNMNQENKKKDSWNLKAIRVSRFIIWKSAMRLIPLKKNQIIETVRDRG